MVSSGMANARPSNAGSLDSFLSWHCSMHLMNSDVAMEAASDASLCVLRPKSCESFGRTIVISSDCVYP